jgi:hypothetical protein
MASLLEGLGRSQAVTGFLEDRNRQKAALLDRQIKQQDALQRQTIFDEQMKKLEDLNAPINVTNDLVNSMFPQMTEGQKSHAVQRWKELGFLSEDEQGRLESSKAKFAEGIDFFTNLNQHSQEMKANVINDLVTSARIGQADLEQKIALVNQQLQASKKPEEQRQLTGLKTALMQQQQTMFRSEKALLGELPQPETTEGEFEDRVFTNADGTIRKVVNIRDPQAIKEARRQGLQPEGPASLVTIQQAKPASPTERKDIAEAQASIDNLQNLRGLFDESFVGPIAGRVGTVNQIFGRNEAQRERFIAATAAFKNQIIKEITGAQMSEVEANRILKQIPDVNDPPSVWLAKWEESVKNLENIQKRRIQILKDMGLKAPEIGRGVGTAEDFLKKKGGR